MKIKKEEAAKSKIIHEALSHRVADLEVSLSLTSSLTLQSKLFHLQKTMKFTEEKSVLLEGKYSKTKFAYNSLLEKVSETLPNLIDEQEFLEKRDLSYIKERVMKFKTGDKLQTLAEVISPSIQAGVNLLVNAFGELKIAEGY